MKSLIPEMASLLADGQPYALATVIRRSGSAPRSPGAKMLVRSDGSTLGTVGGGMLEAQVQQLALQVLRDRRAVVRGFQFSGQDAASMDAICGGQVEVLVERFDPAEAHLAAIVGFLLESVESHRPAWLVTGLPPSGAQPGQLPGERAAERVLLAAGGEQIGELPPGLQAETIRAARTPAIQQTGGQSYLVEPLDISGTAYIFGAGHVSQSLAGFTRAVGFWTVVLDDRAEYASPERFPIADERIVLDSFADAFSAIHVDRDSYLVIVTRGHLNDRIVLAQALHTGAGYIGMIGSRRKCALIYDELRREGFTDPDIARVHGPIGLPISAETPEEIGVSIVAEMIQARAKNSSLTPGST